MQPATNRSTRAALIAEKRAPSPLSIETQAIEAHGTQLARGITIKADWMRDRATIRTPFGGIVLLESEGETYLDTAYALWESADITIAEALALAAVPHIIRAEARQ
jgi:hypothetical protein